ncbi:MAG TPA: phospholipase D-like domain-containing protein [Byssovorax sp.]|jgi:phosphatidylserine/phosphatidylglycerophosphate/cardiolipin synthase-like enzyme
MRRPTSKLRALALALSLAACAGGARPATSIAPPPTVARPAPAARSELVESIPRETDLALAGVPDAADVWLEMIRGARRSIDLAEFYVSDAPGSRLHAVLVEIERAAARGVHVRLLVDELFHAKYPEVPDAWAKLPNVEVRRLDLKPGVLHAKYFVVDGADAYVGSENFDWRSLDHIFEIGARTSDAAIVKPLLRVFEADWAHTTADLGPFVDGPLTLGVSPEANAGGAAWSELPRLVAWIGAAKRTIRVEVLTYKTKNRDGSEFRALDDALRAAAARGVHVELLVSTWGEEDAAVAALATLPNVEVKVIAIPPHSSGDIPFARVAHAKYAVFDDDRAWVGTSNWEGDYFVHSRNVSLFAAGGGLTARAAQVFEGAWRSRYARPLAALHVANAGANAGAR